MVDAMKDVCVWPKAAVRQCVYSAARNDPKRSFELVLADHAMPPANPVQGGVIMSLEQYSYFAEIIASFAVVASLIFVALEIRKNTRESEIANWGTIADRFNAVYSQTDDVQLANLIAKGRESYSNLSDGEKIAFGHYLEQICIANQAFLILAKDQVHASDTNLSMFRKHMRFHLGFKGSREWYDEFEKLRGFPPEIGSAIRDAIE